MQLHVAITVSRCRVSESVPLVSLGIECLPSITLGPGSGFETGPAKRRPNLASWLFSKIGTFNLAGAGFETGATNEPLGRCLSTSTAKLERNLFSLGFLARF